MAVVACNVWCEACGSGRVWHSPLVVGKGHPMEDVGQCTAPRLVSLEVDELMLRGTTALDVVGMIAVVVVSVAITIAVSVAVAIAIAIASAFFVILNLIVLHTMPALRRRVAPPECNVSANNRHTRTGKGCAHACGGYGAGCSAL